MRVDDSHFCRFADNGDGGAGQGMAETRNRIEGAEAADLLVIAQQQMDWFLERRFLEHWQHSQTNRVETFHVAGAAAVNPAIMLAQREGIARPFLTLDGHDVGMTRENDTAVDIGANRQEQGGLVALGIGNPDRTPFQSPAR